MEMKAKCLLISWYENSFNQPIVSNSIYPTAGHFGELNVKRFCMSVRDSVISGDMYDAEKADVMEDSDARFVLYNSCSDSMWLLSDSLLCLCRHTSMINVGLSQTT